MSLAKKFDIDLLIMQDTIKVKAIETFLFTKAEPGIIGMNYDSKPALKIQQKNIKNQNANNTTFHNFRSTGVRGANFNQSFGEASFKEIPSLAPTTISHLCHLSMAPPPLLRPIEGMHDVGPPLHYFAPSQEVLQILIRKAYSTKNMNDLNFQIEKAFQAAEKEIDVLE